MTSSPDLPDAGGSAPKPANRSRRYLLGALPVAALAVAACSKDTTTEAKEAKELGPPPRPATPDEAIAVLMEGNKRFVDRRPEVRDTAEIKTVWTSISTGQQPFATILTCADSRLGPELIFDQFVGDIFVVREAGNIADSPTNLGSIEFGQAVLGSKVLMVLGHSDCGAVKAALEKATPGANIQAIIDAIAPGIAGATDLDDAITRNVRAVIDRIRTKSTLLRDAEKAGAVKIVGAVYNIKTAEVTLL
ncbi:MAG TPA: carbonic anhydrase [Mycobacterium sp.]|nr:carbonic anhydrase [Mycobacterium sp.]HPZ94380.1 carbonic anhydrase [Mycobacterium sp.]HQE16199.1 carbonic anhydrase [Mycobacterium sp.]